MFFLDVASLVISNSSIEEFSKACISISSRFGANIYFNNFIIFKCFWRNRNDGIIFNQEHFTFE